MVRRSQIFLKFNPDRHLVTIEILSYAARWSKMHPSIAAVDDEALRHAGRAARSLAFTT
jgi:hypothetical protein